MSTVNSDILFFSYIMFFTYYIVGKYVISREACFCHRIKNKKVIVTFYLTILNLKLQVYISQNCEI